ncbi:MAG: rod shape-determining protein MreC [bacterium]
MRKVFKKSYVLTGAIILLIFFHYFGWLKFFENKILVVSNPLGNFFLSSKQWIDFRISDGNLKKDILEKYDKCISEKKDSDAAQIEVQLIKEENETLKSMLNFMDDSGYKLISGRIISKSTDSISSAYIINLGEKNGIKTGMAVVVNKGLLIGIVQQVNEESAFVRLINDPNSRIAAIVLNSNKSIGVIEGGFGLSVKMDLIPQNETILVGDMVVTSGLDGSIPSGLYIGKIIVSENESYQPFQKALILPAADLKKVSLVSVIVPD